jgi:hypothetical protein
MEYILFGLIGCATMFIVSKLHIDDFYDIDFDIFASTDE